MFDRKLIEKIKNKAEKQKDKKLEVFLRELDNSQNKKDQILAARKIVRVLKERAMYSTLPSNNEIMVRTIRNVKNNET